MITRIKFDKLFGMFDYDIHLMEGGVTIITGPNGFGKSTILKTIDAFCSLDILFFHRLDFDEISFFSNTQGDPIVIKKEKNHIEIDSVKIDINYFKHEIMRIRRRNYFRLSHSEWRDRRTGEIVTTDDIVKSYLQNEDFDDEFEISSDDYLMLREKIRSYAGETKFIKEQRLIKERKDRELSRYESQTINVIDELPQQVKEKIKQFSSLYSSKANQLDSTYPHRLFETKEGITEDEYTDYLKNMNEKLEKLNKYNISDIQKPENDVLFLEEHSKALKVYFDDFIKKYSVFEELIDQLDLFTDIINSRLKFKEIRISREEGIEVYKLNTDDKLMLSQLSSGEKQEIILFYELVFESDKNIHLLIDEPEISLHIGWQAMFMDDLLKIADKKKFKVTVATHSPHIINNHWDIQIDLGELYGN